MKHIKTFESFLSEASTALGSKAKKFTDAVEAWDFYTDAGDKDGNMPIEYQKVLKTLNVKPDDAVVCYSGANGDWANVLDTAKKSGIEYAEVDDDETGEKAILFSAKQ